jgi:DNA-binding transcriptional ArsR family regulator
MTEEKIKESPGDVSSSEEKPERVESWGLLVTKSTVRLKIWQILQLFGELNVTQISNYLKESKSTVSRHLNGMFDDGLVKSREDESCCEGRIPPKLFSINDMVYKQKSGIEMEQGYPDDFNERIDYIQKEIQTNRSSIEMISGIMRLLEPLYKEVEDLIKEGSPESLELADKIFQKYMWGPKGENITWFQFNYQTPEMYFLEKEIHEVSYKVLSDDYDPESFEEERLRLKEKLKQAKVGQKDPSVPKKYGRFAIFMPLRKIFNRNKDK